MATALPAGFSIEEPDVPPPLAPRPRPVAPASPAPALPPGFKAEENFDAGLDGDALDAGSVTQTDPGLTASRGAKKTPDEIRAALTDMVGRNVPYGELTKFLSDEGYSFTPDTQSWFEEAYGSPAGAGRDVAEWDIQGPPREVGAGEAAWRGVQGAALRGFADEIAGFSGAVGNKLGTALGMNSSTMDFWDIYQAIADRERRNSDAAWEQQPWAYSAGFIPGMFMGPSWVRSSGSQPLTGLQRARQAATVGGVEGLIAGAGHADTSADENVLNRAPEALFGGLSGIALGPVVDKGFQLGGGVARRVWNGIRPNSSSENSGLAALAERADLNPELMRAEAARFAEAGVPARPVDIVDDEARAIMAEAAGAPTPARAEVAAAAEAARAGAPDRIAAQAERIAPEIPAAPPQQAAPIVRERPAPAMPSEIRVALEGTSPRTRSDVANAIRQIADENGESVNYVASAMKNNSYYRTEVRRALKLMGNYTDEFVDALFEHVGVEVPQSRRTVQNMPESAVYQQARESVENVARRLGGTVDNVLRHFADDADTGAVRRMLVEDLTSNGYNSNDAEVIADRAVQLARDASLEAANRRGPLTDNAGLSQDEEELLDDTISQVADRMGYEDTDPVMAELESGENGPFTAAIRAELQANGLSDQGIERFLAAARQNEPGASTIGHPPGTLESIANEMAPQNPMYEALDEAADALDFTPEELDQALRRGDNMLLGFVRDFFRQRGMMPEQAERLIMDELSRVQTLGTSSRTAAQPPVRRSLSDLEAEHATAYPAAAPEPAPGAPEPAAPEPAVPEGPQPGRRLTARQLNREVATERDAAISRAMDPIRGQLVPVSNAMLDAFATRAGRRALKDAAEQVGPDARAAITEMMNVARSISQLDPRLPANVRQRLADQLLDKLQVPLDVIDKFAIAIRETGRLPGLRLAASTAGRTVRDEARRVSPAYDRALNAYAGRSRVMDAATGKGARFQESSFLDTPPDQFSIAAREASPHKAAIGDAGVRDTTANLTLTSHSDNSGYYHFDYVARNGDRVPFSLHVDQNGKGHIDLSSGRSANALGPHEMRFVMADLQEMIPGLTSFAGGRISGARRAAAERATQARNANRDDYNAASDFLDRVMNYMRSAGAGAEIPEAIRGELARMAAIDPKDLGRAFNDTITPAWRDQVDRFLSEQGLSYIPPRQINMEQVVPALNPKQVARLAPDTYTVSEQDAQRMRWRDEVVDEVRGGRGQRALPTARQIASGPAQQERNVIALGEEEAGRLQQGMRAEVQRVENTNAIDPRFGRRGKGRGDAIVDGFADALAGTVGAATGSRWGPIQLAARWLKQGGIRNVDAERLARDAVSEDPTRVEAAIAYLEKRGMDRARAQRFISIFAGALTGRAAGAGVNINNEAAAPPNSVRAILRDGKRGSQPRE